MKRSYSTAILALWERMAQENTVLMALNVFFRNTQAPSDVVNLHEEDFHRRDTSRPIEITGVFTDLSDVAQEDQELKPYVRQNELEITVRAEWEPTSERAEVFQFGIRGVMEDFAEYFEAENSGEKAQTLKAGSSN